MTARKHHVALVADEAQRRAREPDGSPSEAKPIDENLAIWAEQRLRRRRQTLQPLRASIQQACRRFNRSLPAPTFDRFWYRVSRSN